MRAEVLELAASSSARTDDGLSSTSPPASSCRAPVEDALQHGVPLYFVAEAEVFRDRWYWRDERVARRPRVWRLAYQPLTRN